MGNKSKLLFQGYVGANRATLYSVPARSKARIRRVELSNELPAEQSARLFLGRGSEASALLPDFLLDPDQTVDIECDVALDAKNQVVGIAGAASAVRCSIFGVERAPAPEWFEPALLAERGVRIIRPGAFLTIEDGAFGIVKYLKGMRADTLAKALDKFDGVMVLASDGSNHQVFSREQFWVGAYAFLSDRSRKCLRDVFSRFKPALDRVPEHRAAFTGAQSVKAASKLVSSVFDLDFDWPVAVRTEGQELDVPGLYVTSEGTVAGIIVPDSHGQAMAKPPEPHQTAATVESEPTFGGPPQGGLLGGGGTDPEPPSGAAGGGGGGRGSGSAAQPGSEPRPESRWLNAGIRDHDPATPLAVKKPYLLEIGIDVTQSGAASTRIPDAEVLFRPGETAINLTVRVDSDDFHVAEKSQILRLPETGASVGKVRFEVTALREGRGWLTITLYKDSSFLLQSTVGYSIGTGEAKPPSVACRGRPLHSAEQLTGRDLSFTITEDGGVYHFVTSDVTFTKVRLKLNQAELGGLVQLARDALLSVIGQRDAAGRLVFVRQLDIDDASRDAALRTLARAGALIFQSIFHGPNSDPAIKKAGEWFREWFNESENPRKLEIVAERFPIPWGLLYFGDAGDDATIDWNQFLGMRHVVEQIPMQTEMSVRSPVIESDKPSLAVSINVHAGIDEQMRKENLDPNVVANQVEYWTKRGNVAGGRVLVTHRQRRADLLSAFKRPAKEQVIYFYCHAVTKGPTDKGGVQESCLILTNDERLTLGDLKLNAPMTTPFEGCPLVFINACESAELTPAFYDGFVPYFTTKGARGVIGTECRVPALFASRFALEFFPRFLGGESLGQVVLGLRREFITRHKNPLGLVYAIYCNAHTRIQPRLSG